MKIEDNYLKQEEFDKIQKTFDSFDSEDDLEEQRIIDRMEDPEGGILLN